MAKRKSSEETRYFRLLVRWLPAWTPCLSPAALRLLVVMCSTVGDGDKKYLSGEDLKWSGFDGPGRLMVRAKIKTERGLRLALRELKGLGLVTTYSRGTANGYVLHPGVLPVGKKSSGTNLPQMGNKSSASEEEIFLKGGTNLHPEECKGKKAIEECKEVEPVDQESEASPDDKESPDSSDESAGSTQYYEIAESYWEGCSKSGGKAHVAFWSKLKRTRWPKIPSSKPSYKLHPDQVTALRHAIHGSPTNVRAACHVLAFAIAEWDPDVHGGHPNPTDIVGRYFEDWVIAWLKATKSGEWPIPEEAEF